MEGAKRKKEVENEIREGRRGVKREGRGWRNWRTRGHYGELFCSGSTPLLQWFTCITGCSTQWWNKDSHFSCDIVQPLPYCGPSLPQLLFD